jgi:hypothetical protein
LDKIQLYAALQGRITDEDRDRLNLKLLLLNAENQTGEALNKSAQEATLLSQKILMNNGLVMTYDGLIKNLAKAKNPFEGFDDYLQDLLNKLRDIQLAMNNINSMGRATPPINYGYTRANPLLLMTHSRRYQIRATLQQIMATQPLTRPLFMAQATLCLALMLAQITARGMGLVVHHLDRQPALVQRQM